MTEKLTDLTCADFAARLASPAPVPGGGGASALCGALGAALCAMAARLSPEQEALAERADALYRALLALIDADAEGFAPLAAAYAIPRETPGRAEALRVATLEACRAPMAMLRRTGEALALLEELLPRCKRLLVSDVGCGALLCRAAMESAALNVYVNTRSLPEEDALPLEEETQTLLHDCLPRAEALAAAVTGAVRKERAHG